MTRIGVGAGRPVVLAKSPWRWVMALVGLTFAGPIWAFELPIQDWFFKTIPDVLIMVVMPSVIAIGGLALVVVSLRSGVYLVHETVVSRSYVGPVKRFRLEDIAGVGAMYGSNYAAPCIQTVSGETRPLLGAARMASDGGFFSAREAAREIAASIDRPMIGPPQIVSEDVPGQSS